VALSDDLGRIADAAASFADAEEQLAGVIATEPAAGSRVYLCAYERGGGERSWLALDEAAQPVERRALVRDAVSIAAMCELAEELAAGGDLDELRAQLVALRLTEAPEGVDEAEDAVLALQGVIGAPPRIATPAHLDAVGTATRRLEQALDGRGTSPFTQAMKGAIATVEELTRDVEASYKVALAG
jgi:hypothetical protein